MCVCMYACSYMCGYGVGVCLWEETKKWLWLWVWQGNGPTAVGGGTQTEKDRFGTMYLCSSKKLNEKKNTFLWGMCTINTTNSIIVISLVPGTYMYTIKSRTNIFYFALLRSLFWSIIIICLTQPGRYLGPTCIGPHKHLFHLVAMDGSLEQCKHTPGTAWPWHKHPWQPVSLWCQLVNSMLFNPPWGIYNILI